MTLFTGWRQASGQGYRPGIKNAEKLKAGTVRVNTHRRSVLLCHWRLQTSGEGRESEKDAIKEFCRKSAIAQQTTAANPFIMR